MARLPPNGQLLSPKRPYIYVCVKVFVRSPTIAVMCASDLRSMMVFYLVPNYCRHVCVYLRSMVVFRLIGVKINKGMKVCKKKGVWASFGF